MIALCLGMAGSVWATLPLQSFTLAWQHTVEKVLWEEDYRLSERGLLLEEARVRGSGAGMEIPEGAVLRDGAWHYHRGCRRCNRCGWGAHRRPATTGSAVRGAAMRWRAGSVRRTLSARRSNSGRVRYGTRATERPVDNRETPVHIHKNDEAGAASGHKENVHA